jgi:hypothetical protein
LVPGLTFILITKVVLVTFETQKNAAEFNVDAAVTEIPSIFGVDDKL